MQMKKRKHDILAVVLRWLTRGAAALTALIVLFIVAYLLFKGVPHLSPQLFARTYDSTNVSLLPALVNTLYMTGLALAIAAPAGICAAVYLVEYAKRGSRIVRIIRMAAETLSGIPSIVYGLFGMIAFVLTLGWGYSLLAGACTLAVMVLPLLMRTTEEALLAVPLSYREGSFGLGAGRLRTVFRVVLPAAVPGILSGVILAVGRVVGETAALIFTAGTVRKIARTPMDSAATLAVHMNAIAGEGLYLEQTYATAVVLIALVLAINGVSSLIAKRMTKGRA